MLAMVMMMAVARDAEACHGDDDGDGDADDIVMCHAPPELCSPGTNTRTWLR